MYKIIIIERGVQRTKRFYESEKVFRKYLKKHSEKFARLGRYSQTNYTVIGFKLTSVDPIEWEIVNI